MLQKHQPKLSEMASPSQEPGWEPTEMDTLNDKFNLN